MSMPPDEPPYSGPPEPSWPQNFVMRPPLPKRPWYKKKRFAIPLGTLAAILLISRIVGPSEDPAATVVDPPASSSTPAPNQAKKAKPKKVAPGVGAKVRDGKFQFVVGKMTTRSSVGDGDFGQQAQGKYLLIHVKVTNIGDKAQSFDDSNQELYDAAGRKYEADSGSAAMYLGDSNSFLNDINPGNAVNGILLFDVPKTMTPASIVLHDSVFSGGVKVRL